MSRLDLLGERGPELRYCLWAIQRVVQEARRRHLDLPPALLGTLTTLDAYFSGDGSIHEAAEAVCTAVSFGEDGASLSEDWPSSQMSRLHAGLWRAVAALRDAELPGEVESRLIRAHAAMEELLMDSVNASRLRDFAYARAKAAVDSGRRTYLDEQRERAETPSAVEREGPGIASLEAPPPDARSGSGTNPRRKCP